MKKILRLLIALLLILLVLLIPWDRLGKQTETVTSTVKLVEVNKFGGTMAVFCGGDDSAVYFLSLTDAILTDENGDSISVSALSPGTVAEITWNGQVQLSDPSGISADSFQVVGLEDDLVGLYRSVLTDLWDAHGDLTQNAKQLDLDLSALTDLTAAEQTALAYLCTCKMGYISYDLSPWDELTADGSVAFAITPVGEPADGAFSFAVEMRRGASEEAVRVTYAAARGEDGQWSYTELP